MSKAVTPRRARRFWSFLLRGLILTLCGGVLVIVGFAFVFLQDDSGLDPGLPPTPQDVTAARDLLRDVRTVAGTGAPLQTSVAQLNSVLRLAARFIPDLRAQVRVETDALSGAVSIPVKWWNGRKWLNISATLPEFDETLKLEAVTIGARPVPGALALGVMRNGANIVIGDTFGDKVFQAVTAMNISSQGPVFRIALDEVGKNGVMQSTFATLRGAQMPTSEEIENYHVLIRSAMERGTLQPTGSFLPYVQFTLKAALADSTPETLPNTYTAAIFGLAKACGARDFSMIVGRLAFDKTLPETNWSTTCETVTFNARVDSRRHFVTAAALQAASNRGVAVSIGEFKELYDSISGAGGFDFTDMAANLSGIRMSNVLTATPPEGWHILLDQLEDEHDLIVPFEGIPPLMDEDTFKAQYGDINSPQYKAMLALIETKIDQLDFYQGR